MQLLTIRAEIEEYGHFSELPEDEQSLISLAREASENAYAPYSGFRVGAAVLLADGTLVKGNNQENVAYPSGLCAERTALFWAGANYPGVAVKKLAIYAYSLDFEVVDPVYPCGACRQVMSEYERLSSGPIRILMSAAGGKVHAVNGLINILPVAFNADNLKR